MNFSGSKLIVPVFTPFKENGQLNLDIIPKYFDFLMKADSLDGILVNGTTGEGMSMNVQERKLCAEAWRKVIDNNMHMMVQVGGVPLPDVIELTKHAEKIGANSILCLPDLYMKPKSFSELNNYLKFVSDAAPKTPLLFYHIPMFTNLHFHMGDFLEQIKDKVPTFVGIKYTSDDLEIGCKAVAADSSKYRVFLGADKLMLQSNNFRFNSAIATTFNLFPTTGKYLYCQGNAIQARNMKQDSLNKLIREITCNGQANWVPSMKAAMNILSPVNCGPVRPPMSMARLKDDEIKELAATHEQI